MDRKGTEKQIEIFIALFIILAIALFGLSYVQQQAKAYRPIELQYAVAGACQQKCTEAGNSGCSLASMASLCAYGSRNVLKTGEYLDLNRNGKKDIDTTLLAGIGVCEDHVYCFQMMDSCCAQHLSAVSCRDILLQYWSSQGLSAELLSDVVPSGIPSSCSQTGAITWNALASSEDLSWK